METKILEKRQKELAKKVSLCDRFRKIRTVGGFDLAYSGKRVFCSGVVLDWETLRVAESKTSVSKETFPYVPGFLAFREAPHIIRVYRKLSVKPDIILIDGQGLCHPRRIGVASHIGVLLDKPAIGVAKSKLCGDYKEPGKSGVSKLFLEGEHVGWVLRKERKHIFISPGHKVSVKSSLGIVSHCMLQGRIPESLRLAHLYARESKNKYENR